MNLSLSQTHHERPAASAWAARRARRVAGRLSLIVFVALALAAPAAQREAKEQHLMITVATRDDTPIKDLTPAEIKVREDGVSREVLRVGPATGPLDVVLLLDDSDISQLAINEIRQGAAGFVKQILDANPQSQITLMTFGDRPTVLVPATSSATALGKGIERIFGRKGSGAYMLQAVSDAARILAKSQSARRNIVAFDIEDGPEFSNDTNQSITTALKNAKATLWTVVLQEQHGVAPVTPEARERAIVMGDVTRDSGGGNHPVLARQGIPPGMTWAATMITGQLDVTYSRPESLIPPDKIEVEVARKNTRVWATRWGGR
jgi:hypothetical protein